MQFSFTSSLFASRNDLILQANEQHAGVMPVNHGAPTCGCYIWMLAFGVLAILCVSGSAATPNPRITEWLIEMRADDLALSSEEIDSLQLNSQNCGMHKTELAAKYSTVRRRIKDFRSELSREYSTCMDAAAKSLVVSLAEEFVTTTIADVLAPIWSGTQWDFNGYSARPQSGTIACGWFLQRIMSAAGFTIEPDHGVQIAHLGPQETVISYTGKAKEMPIEWSQAQEQLAAEGPGLYIAGFWSGWGHVIFLGKTETGATSLIHSGPTQNEACVCMEDADLYFTSFIQPDSMWVGKLDHSVIEKWLLETPITPVR